MKTIIKRSYENDGMSSHNVHFSIIFGKNALKLGKIFGTHSAKPIRFCNGQIIRLKSPRLLLTVSQFKVCESFFADFSVQRLHKSENRVRQKIQGSKRN